MSQEIIDIFPAYEEYLQYSRFKVAYGGRGSAKTRTFCTILTNNVLHFGWRVVCFREVMETISESVYQEFKAEIERRDLGRWFEVLQTEIRCPISGGVIKFSGIKSSSKRLDSQKLKGFSDFDAAWLEEANPVSAESWRALIPTMRKPDSEIWVSFNPENPLEETYKRFVTERHYPDFKDGRRYCIVKKINYSDNPRFPKELQDDMELMKVNDYEMYRHIYEGEPVANSDLSIIKPIWIEAAVDAHKFIQGFKMGGGKIAGFDVSGGVEGDIAAPKSNDPNAFLWRYGQVVGGLHEWHDDDPNAATNTAYGFGLEAKVDLINADNIGVGAAVPGEFRRLEREALEANHKTHRIRFNGWTASESPLDPEGLYRDGKTNHDMFFNLKAQGWGLLADRFRETWQARQGLPFDADKLISLPVDLPYLSKLKAELSQPRKKIVNGRLQVESKKDLKARGIPSHNLADACVMAFAAESGFNLQGLI